MANLLAHFEPTELIDFMNFIGLSIHKLQEDMSDVLDELIGPLSAHINGILAQPVTGTDDQVTHVDAVGAEVVMGASSWKSVLSPARCGGSGGQ